MAQLSSLAVTLAVRIASPDAFAQIQLDTAHQEKQRDYFLLIVVIPYFVCFLLSFLCALYVVKALLAQTRRDKQVKKSKVKISRKYFFGRPEKQIVNVTNMVRLIQEVQLRIHILRPSKSFKGQKTFVYYVFELFDVTFVISVNANQIVVCL